MNQNTANDHDPALSPAEAAGRPSSASGRKGGRKVAPPQEGPSKAAIRAAMKLAALEGKPVPIGDGRLAVRSDGVLVEIGPGAVAEVPRAGAAAPSDRPGPDVEIMRRQQQRAEELPPYQEFSTVSAVVKTRYLEYLEVAARAESDARGRTVTVPEYLGLLVAQAWRNDEGRYARSARLGGTGRREAFNPAAGAWDRG